MRASYFARRWIVQVSLGFTSQIQLARPSQARPIPQVRTLPCPPPRRATTENQLNEPPNPARVLLAAHVRLHDVVARSAPARAIPYSRPLERRAPRSRQRRRLGGQPEVREDRHHHLALGNVADDRSVTATIAGQNVQRGGELDAHGSGGVAGDVEAEEILLRVDEGPRGRRSAWTKVRVDEGPRGRRSAWTKVRANSYWWWRRRGCWPRATRRGPSPIPSSRWRSCPGPRRRLRRL